MFRKIIQNTKGIHVNEFQNGINIWFDPKVDHTEFFKFVKINMIEMIYMGIDEVNGRYGDCYFFPYNENYLVSE